MTSSASELPRISVTSDGGITGRGVGGIIIDNGQVTATLQQKSCSGRADRFGTQQAAEADSDS